MLRKLLVPLTVALLFAGPALALPTTYEIDAHIAGLDFSGGPLNEFQEGIGFATFDSPTVDGRAVLIDFELNILSQTFFEQDATDYPDAPLGTIQGGELVGVNFFGVNDNGAFLSIAETFVFSMQIARGGHIIAGQMFFREVGGGGGGGTTSPMPEPTAALVFAFGLTVVARRRSLI